MSRRRSALLAVSFALLALVAGVAWQTGLRRPEPRLVDVGPRIVSNQTAQPLSLQGANFRRGMRLRVGPPFERTVPIAVVDTTHAYARLPADLTLPPETPQVTVALSVEGQRAPPEAGLTVVNDAGFADWTQLVRAGDLLWAASATTDALARVDPATGEVTRFPGGDGPSALATWTEPDGTPRLAVAHAWASEVWILDARSGAVVRTLAAPAYATGLAVDPGRRLLLVAETAENTVRALSLDDGREVWRRDVLPDPRPLAVAGASVVVGSQATGELESLGLDDGRSGESIGPRPGTPIIGGHSEPHARDVMGGKAPRALLWSPRLAKLFVTSIGPNVGPNPQRMEVSMNGGVGAVDLGARRFERHLGFGAGVTEGMALDEETGRLYLADSGLGLVHAVDAAALSAGDGPARKAELWRLAVPPPPGFPLARDTADYGVNGRAGVELHSGPRALVLSASGTQLYVLDRFTATVAVVERRAHAPATAGPADRARAHARSPRAAPGAGALLRGHGPERDELRQLPSRGARRGHPLREDAPPAHLPEPHGARHARDSALLHPGEHVQPGRDLADGRRPQPVHEPDPDRVRGPPAHALQRDRHPPAQPLPRP